MIKIGIAGIPHHTKGQGTEAGARYLCSIGLDAMEIQFGRNVYMTAKSAKECAEVGKECNIEFSIHAPYYINLTSKNKDTQEKSKQWILKSVRVAHNLGAGIVVFHAARENDTELVISHMKEIKNTMSGEGISVALGLETMGDAGEFGSPEDIMEVMKQVPGTDMVIDFAHIHSRGNGALRSINDYEAVFDKIAPVKKNNFHIHFSNIEYKNSREIRHLPLDGEPDFRQLVKVLADRKLDATIICESPLLEEDALKMKKIIECIRT